MEVQCEIPIETPAKDILSIYPYSNCMIRYNNCISKWDQMESKLYIMLTLS